MGQLGCPGMHNAHTLSVVSVHALTVYCPMLHLVHGIDAILFGQYVEFTTHLVHILLVCDVQAEVSNSPVEHGAVQTYMPPSPGQYLSLSHGSEFPMELGQ